MVTFLGLAFFMVYSKLSDDSGFWGNLLLKYRRMNNVVSRKVLRTQIINTKIKKKISQSTPDLPHRRVPRERFVQSMLYSPFEQILPVRSSGFFSENIYSFIIYLCTRFTHDYV